MGDEIQEAKKRRIRRRGMMSGLSEIRKSAREGRAVEREAVPVMCVSRDVMPGMRGEGMCNV